MRNKRYVAGTSRLFAGVLVSYLVAAPDALSEQENLICAAVNVVACVGSGTCEQGTAQTFDVPTFMIIDFENKLIHTRGEVAGDAVSHIRSSEKGKDSILLQGFEEGRGWTLALNSATGHMRLSATGPSMNFTITGNCTRY